MMIIIVVLLLGELLVLDCLVLGWREVVFVSWDSGSLSVTLGYSLNSPIVAGKLSGIPGSVEAER